MTELTAGMPINDTLLLECELGEGGMGRIWIAQDRISHDRVVVKILAAELFADEQSRMRFEREASQARQVDSPHVVRTFGHGIAPSGLPYIAMELLQGRDLGKVLEADKRLAPLAVATMMQQVAHALGRAHEVGIVHRDIKPENIFLLDTDDGSIAVKLLDFGLAVGTNTQMRMTATGALVGTPYYWSPEQSLSARNVDHRSDLWSLAIVAFQALTGRLPFEANNFAALTLQIHNAPVPVPSSINPSLGPAIDAWAEKALTRDPSKRFQSAPAMAAALRDAIAGVAPRPSGASEHPLARTVLTGTPLPVPVPAGLGEAAAAARTPSSPGSNRPVETKRSAPPTQRLGSKRPPILAIVIILISVGVIAFVVGRGRGGDPAPKPAESAR
jgi:serine/threonine-protein kinase